MFVGQSKIDARFIYNFYKYTKNTYTKNYHCFYERLNSFFTFESLFAFTVRLPKEVIAEICEYNYKLYIKKNKNYFFINFFFNWLAKVYFVKYYGKIRNKNISYLFIYDDNTIQKKACIVAARALKINYTIIVDGYKSNTLCLESFGTRWCAAVPHNAQFYLELNSERQTKRSTMENNVVVILQNDASVDAVLYAPLISTQKELMQLVAGVANILQQTNFIIINYAKNWGDYENIQYSQNNIEALLSSAKCVITINAPEAIAALDYEVPIIAFGDAIYNIQGIAVVPRTQSEIIEIINKPSLYYNKKIASGFLDYIDAKSVMYYENDIQGVTTFESILRL